MAAIDRTDEFLKAVSAHVSSGVRPVYTPVLSKDKNSSTADAKEFTQKASSILKKIQFTSKRLATLAERTFLFTSFSVFFSYSSLDMTVTRKQGIYDDKADTINSLASQIKNDTKLHKSELDDLEVLLYRRKNGKSKDSSAHFDNVVSTIKVQLANTFQQFKSILEQRQTSMQKKTDRRGLFGKNKLAPLSTRSPAIPVPVQQRQLVPLNGGSKASIITSNYNDPQPNGIAFKQGQSMISELPLIPDTASQSLDNEKEESVVLIQSNEAQQLDTYLSSRAEAVSVIEGHIAELGQVFNQLASMVAMSAQSIDRIDNNVQDTLVSMQMGTLQLDQTWNSLQGNRWLFAKVMFVLMLFVAFFVMFMV